MSPRKLSDNDREKILDLYRNSEETTSTLAIRYGVSSSTISRFLKNNLSESEYEDLIQQKRLARTPYTSISNEDDDEYEANQNSEVNLEEKVVTSSPPDYIDLSVIEPLQNSSILKLKSIKDKQKDLEEVTGIEAIKEIVPPEPLSFAIEKNINTIEEKTLSFNNDIKAPVLDKKNKSKSSIYLDDDEAIESIDILQEMFGEDMDDDDDDGDDYDDDIDWEDDDISSQEIPISTRIQILPLSEASFPRTCYLVIDRYSDLITRPLKDFADLGDIPSEEVMQKTLPVFENHRVAKRFSNRRGKVIKVPDARILQKTSEHLYAKGITRLLIDGNIYSLS